MTLDLLNVGFVLIVSLGVLRLIEWGYRRADHGYQKPIYSSRLRQ